MPGWNDEQLKAIQDKQDAAKSVPTPTVPKAASPKVNVAANPGVGPGIKNPRRLDNLGGPYPEDMPDSKVKRDNVRGEDDNHEVGEDGVPEMLRRDDAPVETPAQKAAREGKAGRPASKDMPLADQLIIDTAPLMTPSELATAKKGWAEEMDRRYKEAETVAKRNEAALAFANQLEDKQIPWQYMATAIDNAVKEGLSTGYFNPVNPPGATPLTPETDKAQGDTSRRIPVASLYKSEGFLPVTPNSGMVPTPRSATGEDRTAQIENARAAIVNRVLADFAVKYNTTPYALEMEANLRGIPWAEAVEKAKRGGAWEGDAIASETLKKSAAVRGVDLGTTKRLPVPSGLDIDDKAFSPNFSTSTPAGVFYDPNEDEQIARPGEKGHDVAMALLERLEADGIDAGWLSTIRKQADPFQAYLDKRIPDLMEETAPGEGPGSKAYDAAQRGAWARAVSEVAALKTAGLWTAPIFLRGLDQRQFKALGLGDIDEALLPDIEVVGFGNNSDLNHPNLVLRQRSTAATVFDAMDLPLYAGTALVENIQENAAKKENPYESDVANFLFAPTKEGEELTNPWDAVKAGISNRRDPLTALLESDFAIPRQSYDSAGNLLRDKDGLPLTTENWRPAVAATLGLALSVVSPDTLVGAGLVRKGISGGIKLADAAIETKNLSRAYRNLNALAEARTAGGQLYRSAMAAEDAGNLTEAKRLRDLANTEFKRASDIEGRAFSESRPLMRNLDIADTEIARGLEATAPSIADKHLLADLDIPDASGQGALSNALLNVHPGERQALLRAEHGRIAQQNASRIDLFSTEAQLERVEDAFRRAESDPAIAARVQNARLYREAAPFVANLEAFAKGDQPTLDTLKAAREKLRSGDVTGFLRDVSAARSLPPHMNPALATSPADAAARTQLRHQFALNVAAAAQHYRTGLSSPAAYLKDLKRAAQDAILVNNESRAAAAGVLLDGLERKVNPNLGVRSTTDPTLALQNRLRNVAPRLSEPARKLLEEAKAAGGDEAALRPVVAIYDTRARVNAYRKGTTVAEEWKKLTGLEEDLTGAKLAAAQSRGAEVLYDIDSHTRTLKAELAQTRKQLKAARKRLNELDGSDFIDREFSYRFDAKQREKFKVMLRDAFARDNDDFVNRINDPDVRDGLGDFFGATDEDARAEIEKLTTEVKRLAEREVALKDSLLNVSIPGLIAEDPTFLALGRTPKVTEVADWVRNTGSDAEKLILERILPDLPAVVFEIDHLNMPGFSGKYSPSLHRIKINLGAATRKTVLHEMLHAATSHRIDVAPNSPEVQRLRQLWETASARAVEQGKTHYGLKNLDEFIAEAFSNAEFQAWLKETPSTPEVKSPSLWSRFTTALTELFGRTKDATPTMLDEVTQAIDDLLQIDQPDFLLDPSRRSFGYEGYELYNEALTKAHPDLSRLAVPEGFFSPLQRALGRVFEKNGGAAGLKADYLLREAMKQPGVKADELEWSGIAKWLREQGNRKVTSAEIASELAKREPVISVVGASSKEASPEVVEASRRIAEADRRISEIQQTGALDSISVGELNPLINGAIGLDNRKEVVDSIMLGLTTTQPLTPQMKSIITELGRGESASIDLSKKAEEDFAMARRGLARLPDDVRSQRLAHIREYLELLVERDAAQQISLQGVDFDNGPRFGDYVAPGKSDNYREIRFLQNDPDGLTELSPGQSVRQHFEPNTVAHLRTTDRIGPNGEKILFVEEVQSDWHQAGVKHGYMSQEDAQRLELLRQQQKQLAAEEKALEAEYDLIDPEDFSPESDAKRGSLGKRIRGNQSKQDYTDEVIRSINDRGGVARGTHSELWRELALKQALQIAAKEGYDGIALTRGDIIQDVVGGDVQGQQVFYNEILPKTLEKLAGEKGGSTRIQLDFGKRVPVDDDWQESESAVIAMKGGSQSVPYLPITPTLRERVMTEGMALYSKAESASKKPTTPKPAPDLVALRASIPVLNDKIVSLDADIARIEKRLAKLDPADAKRAKTTAELDKAVAAKRGYLAERARIQGVIRRAERGPVEGKAASTTAAPAAAPATPPPPPPPPDIGKLRLALAEATSKFHEAQAKVNAIELDLAELRKGGLKRNQEAFNAKGLELQAAMKEKRAATAFAAEARLRLKQAVEQEAETARVVAEADAKATPATASKLVQPEDAQFIDPVRQLAKKLGRTPTAPEVQQELKIGINRAQGVLDEIAATAAGGSTETSEAVAEAAKPQRVIIPQPTAIAVREPSDLGPNEVIYPDPDDTLVIRPQTPSRGRDVADTQVSLKPPPDWYPSSDLTSTVQRPKPGFDEAGTVAMPADEAERLRQMAQLNANVGTGTPGGASTPTATMPMPKKAGAGSGATTSPSGAAAAPGASTGAAGGSGGVGGVGAGAGAATPGPAAVPPSSTLPLIMEQGKIVLDALASPDPNSLIHALGHVIRQGLDDSEVYGLNAWLKSTSSPALLDARTGKWVAATPGATLTPADVQNAEDAFTDALRSYINNGKAPPGTAPALDDIKRQLAGVLAASPSPLPPETQRLYDRLLGFTPDPAAQAEAKKAARDPRAFQLGLLRRLVTGPPVQAGPEVYRELSKAAQSLGIDVDSKALKDSIEKTGKIEFPTPVLGRIEYTLDDLATMQLRLEEEWRASRDELPQRLAISGAHQAHRETWLTDKIESALKAGESDSRSKKVAKAAGRFVAATVIGMDATDDLRKFPESVRSKFLVAQRKVETTYADAVKLIAERDPKKLRDYLLGVNVGTKHERQLSSAGISKVGPVRDMLSSYIDTLSDEARHGLDILSRNPAVDALSPEDKDDVAAAVSALLYNNSSPAFNKQLVQVLGLPDVAPGSGVVNSLPQTAPFAGALYRLAKNPDAATGLDAFVAGARQLAGEEGAARAQVLLAGHGAAGEMRSVWRELGIAVSREDALLFKNWVNGEKIPENKLDDIRRIARRIGMDADFVEATGLADAREFVPSEAMGRLQKALMKKTPDRIHWLMSPEDLRDTAASSAGKVAGALISALKVSRTRGIWALRKWKVFADSVDHVYQMGQVAGLGTALATSARVLPQTIIALFPGIPRILYHGESAGVVKPGSLERLKDMFQAGGDKAAHVVSKVMTRGALRFEVNSVLKGGTKPVTFGGKVYRSSDLRRIAEEEGIFSSFPREQDTVFRKAATDAASTWQKLGAAPHELESYVEDMAEGWAERERLGAMLTLMETGLDPRTAAKVAVNALFDYGGSVHNAERSILMSIFFPFWSFEKNARRMQVNALTSTSLLSRMNAIRRFQEYTPEAITQALYLSQVDPYGLDVSQLPPEARENYYAMRAEIESHFGRDPRTGLVDFTRVPPEVRDTMRSIFRNLGGYEIRDGDLYQVSKGVRDMTRASNMDARRETTSGQKAHLGTEEAAIPRPDPSGRATFRRDIGGVALTPRFTRELNDYYRLMRQQYGEVPYLELYAPETTIETGVRGAASTLATYYMAGHILKDMLSKHILGEPDDDAPLKSWETSDVSRLYQPLRQVLDTDRAFLLPEVTDLLTDSHAAAPTRISKQAYDVLRASGFAPIAVKGLVDPFATATGMPEETAQSSLIPGRTTSEFQAHPERIADERYYIAPGPASILWQMIAKPLDEALFLKPAPFLPGSESAQSGLEKAMDRPDTMDAADLSEYLQWLLSAPIDETNRGQTARREDTRFTKETTTPAVP